MDLSWRKEIAGLAVVESLLLKFFFKLFTGKTILETKIISFEKKYDFVV
jgi:hypothetical protein